MLGPASLMKSNGSHCGLETGHPSKLTKWSDMIDGKGIDGLFYTLENSYLVEP